MHHCLEGALLGRVHGAVRYVGFAGAHGVLASRSVVDVEKPRYDRRKERRVDDPENEGEKSVAACHHGDHGF